MKIKLPADYGFYGYTIDMNKPDDVILWGDKIKSTYIIDDKTICVFDKTYEKLVYSQHCFIVSVRKFGDNNYAIFTDQIFEILSDELQAALVQHEIGHIQNGDYKDNAICNNNISLRSLIKNLNKEFKADEYAARIIGHCQVINSWKWILGNVKLSIISSIELKLRIKHLKQYKG